MIGANCSGMMLELLIEYSRHWQKCMVNWSMMYDVLTKCLWMLCNFQSSNSTIGHLTGNHSLQYRTDMSYKKKGKYFRKNRFTTLTVAVVFEWRLGRFRYRHIVIGKRTGYLQYRGSKL